jgi:hypothetical protein
MTRIRAYNVNERWRRRTNAYSKREAARIAQVMCQQSPKGYFVQVGAIIG